MSYDRECSQLCRYKEGVSLSASRYTLGSSASPWNSCKDYWFINWLVLRDCECCKCGGGVSSFFPVNAGVKQGGVLAPSFFNTCMDWVLGRVVEQSHCGASVGNTEITNLVFGDDAAIFPE